MSRSIGPVLPSEIMSILDGADPDLWVGSTFTLITADRDDWPHVALLSVGEVLATDDRTVRLALWPGSTTTKNLSTRGRGTLMFVGRGVWYVHLDAERGQNLAANGIDRAYFECRVEDVLHDSVTYATITSGIGFYLPDRAAVVAGWRRVVGMLRAAEPVARRVSTAADDTGPSH